MNDLVENTLRHLEKLVAADTQNPPRDIDEDGIFSYVREQLDGFETEAYDLGEGCIGLHARRGEPDLLFNFHLDTVPASDDWSSDPFGLRVDEERAVGLGACDIKGASACMLAAIAETEGDVALLFTSDEEAGSSLCVRHFLADTHEYRGVVVAEPTKGAAVAEHRGIMTATATFRGIAGHASNARALDDNALHHAVRWAEEALAYASYREGEDFRGLRGIRFNLGTVEGGTKPNVIAPSAEVRFGFRPRPDQSPERIYDNLRDLAPDPERVEWERGFVAPALPSPSASSDSGRQLAGELGLDVAEPVDFWTEAALFSDAGYPTVVFGPGDIDQAHTADEWVALEQLERVAESYVELLAE